MPLGEGEGDSNPPWGLDLGWRCGGRVIGGALLLGDSSSGLDLGWRCEGAGCRWGFSGRFDKVAAAVALLLGHLGLSLPKGAQLIQNVVEKVILKYEFTL
jgi:hypothetical protein